jgi:hypothetical protein
MFHNIFSVVLRVFSVALRVTKRKAKPSRASQFSYMEIHGNYVA